MLQHTIFYPQPCNLLSLNFSSHGEDIKAGDVFYKIDTAVGLNKVFLKSKSGHTVILKTTKKNNVTCISLIASCQQFKIDKIK